MQNRIAIVLIFIAALLCGCQNSGVKQQLDLAEAIMEERPDSALEILQQIDGSSLHGEPQARHALLLSQAFNKNYIDETNDSLISVAVNYYKSSDDTYHQMLAFHYMGIVKFHTDFFEDALFYTLQSYDIAQSLNDSINLCRITSLIGRIHRAYYNYQTASEWQMQSLALAKALNHKQWTLNAYYNVSESILYLKRYRDALAYADSAAMLSEIPDLDILEVQYLSNYFLQNNSRADSIFTVIINHGFQPTSEVVAGQALLHPECALEMLDKYVEINNVDILSKSDIEMAYVMTYLKTGDISHAFQMLSQQITSNNDLLSIMGKNPLEKAQQAYSQQFIEKEKERKVAAQYFSIVLCIIIGLLIIIAIFAVFTFQSKQKTRQAKRERDLLLLNGQLKLITIKLSESESELSNRQHKISALEKQINAMTSSHSAQIRARQETAQSLKDELRSLKQGTYDLLVRQFSVIDTLGSVGFRSRTVELPKEAATARLRSEIDSLTKEKIIFRSIDNIITVYNPDLKQGLENLNLIQSEYELVVYILFGLSTQVIAMLMNKSERAVYNLKSRIKKKLTDKNSSFTQEILSIFGK